MCIGVLNMLRLRGFVICSVNKAFLITFKRKKAVEGDILAMEKVTFCTMQCVKMHEWR